MDKDDKFETQPNQKRDRKDSNPRDYISKSYDFMISSALGNKFVTQTNEKNKIIIKENLE